MKRRELLKAVQAFFSLNVLTEYKKRNRQA
jgi:hypothetical protein